MQPGTALAQTFKGFLTSRPLYQHSSNFLRGLQMHKDYCAQKDFTTWAGKGQCHVSPGNKIWLPGGDGPWLGLPGVLGVPASTSGAWLGKGLAKGSDDMRSGTDTEVRRGCGGKCRMKQGSGWSVSEWLLLTNAASPLRLPARLLSQPADPAGAPALPGGCRLLHQHQLSRHVPARPQAGPHNLLRLLSILALRGTAG